MKRLIMKYKILFISLIALLMAISAVSASENDTLIVDEGTYHSFSELDEIINNDSVSEITLENNYKYDDHSIMLERNNSCSINGNGHVIDGITDSEFSISCGSNAVTINNLTFQNCNNSTFAIGSPVVFNNVKFINCSDVSKISFFSLSDNVKFNNCVFEMKEGNYNIIAVSSNNLSVNNTVFNGKGLISSVIKGDHNVRILVENTVIANFTAPFAAAINTKGDVLTVRKSKFLNLHADSSAGAILGKFYALKSDEGELLTPDPFVIEDCEFTNVTSNVDAGAIYFDLDSCAEGVTQYINVFNCSFTDCASRFGGAIALIGGCLNITDSTFKNNSAAFSGGAIYSSWASVNISNSNFTNNNAKVHGAALYTDKGKLTISASNIINNQVTAVYAEDSELNFADSNFDNVGVSVSLDNKYYLYYVENEGFRWCSLKIPLIWLFYHLNLMEGISIG